MYNIQSIKKEMITRIIVLAVLFFLFNDLTYSQTQKVSQIVSNGETLKKNDVINSLSKSLSKDQLKAVEPFVSQSFQGLNQKNKASAEDGIKKFKNYMTTSRINNSNKWQDCGTYCDHENDYGKYTFCYWKCIANGGPPSKTSIPATVKPANVGK